MKPSNLWTLMLIIIFALTSLHTQAIDQTWETEDKQLSLVAKPAYDANTRSLTQVTVILTDNSFIKKNNPGSQQPYRYPPFVFTFTPASQGKSPSQSVIAIAEKATINGSIEFLPLSSLTSTFLYINFYYGTDTVQTRNSQGSILEIPLIESGKYISNNASSSPSVNTDNP